MRTVTGVVLIAAPVWFNTWFTVLARRFDYPDILRRPTDEILERFREGGSSLILTWWAFMTSGGLLVASSVLVSGVRELWGPEHSLTGSTLPPAHRLTGWLVEQDRREDAALVSAYARDLGAPLPRVTLSDGSVCVDVPGLNPATVAPEAVRLRDHER